MILSSPEHEKILNSAVFPGSQGGPLMHVIAAKAVALKEAMSKEFRDYQQQVLDNARVMAKVVQGRGYRIVSGRTDCHLFLLDLRDKPVTGIEAEQALGRANITVNKNSVPNDTRTPTVTSGVRIGSPAMTTRGFKEIEAEKLGHLIADILDAPQDEAVNNKVRAAVKELCDKHPVYRKS
jgi:glycine hydroxymethyltransferase